MREKCRFFFDDKMKKKKKSGQFNNAENCLKWLMIQREPFFAPNWWIPHQSYQTYSITWTESSDSFPLNKSEAKSNSDKIRRYSKQVGQRKNFSRSWNFSTNKNKSYLFKVFFSSKKWTVWCRGVFVFFVISSFLFNYLFIHIVRAKLIGWICSYLLMKNQNVTGLLESRFEGF